LRDLPGVRLFYRDTGGNGAPVVFVHAATGNSRVIDWHQDSPRMDLASKNPTDGPNCDARHDATDILTDTSPAFRPLFTHGLRPCEGRVGAERHPQPTRLLAVDLGHEKLLPVVGAGDVARTEVATPSALADSATTVAAPCDFKPVLQSESHF
jgi:hypothetical protein